MARRREHLLLRHRSGPCLAVRVMVRVRVRARVRARVRVRVRVIHAKRGKGYSGLG